MACCRHLRDQTLRDLRTRKTELIQEVAGRLGGAGRLADQPLGVGAVIGGQDTCASGLDGGDMAVVDIVSVHVLREARRGQKFELRLTAGDPITVRVRDADPGATQQDQDAALTEETQEAGETQAEEATTLNTTSLADLLHMLKRVGGEGQDWF